MHRALLVLASCGNLRALVSGLVLTLMAQAAYTGVLSPVRETFFGIWTISGGRIARSVRVAWIVACKAYHSDRNALGLALATAFAVYRRVAPIRIVSAAGVGMAVALGWLMTFAIAQTSFEVVPVSSITFTGPATDTLMALVAKATARATMDTDSGADTPITLAADECDHSQDHDDQSQHRDVPALRERTRFRRGPTPRGDRYHLP